MDPMNGMWLMIAAIVVASLGFRYATAARRGDVIRAMVEKGAPVPPELFQEPRRRPATGLTFISTGIVLLGLSVASLVFFWALTSPTFGPHGVGTPGGPPPFLPFISAFPFFIGIACLVAGRYLKSHE